MDNKIFISTACLKGDKSYERVLNTFVDNDIFNIELTGVHPHTSKTSLEKIKRKFQKKKVNFTFHNYFPPPKKPIVLNFLTRNKDLQAKCKKIIKESISLAKKLNVSTYAFHPGYLREADVSLKGYFNFHGKKRLSYDKAINLFEKEFFNFYKTLKIDKKNQNTFLGLENLFPNPDGSNDSFMCTFDEINKLFSSKNFCNTNLCLLIDLGHLAIASNKLVFNRYEFLEKVVDKFGDRIFEIHISNNDEISDLHNRITKKSWQLDALKYFKNSGKLVGKTIFTIESRGMTIDQIKHDKELLQERIYKI